MEKVDTETEIELNIRNYIKQRRKFSKDFSVFFMFLFYISVTNGKHFEFNKIYLQKIRYSK